MLLPLCGEVKIFKRRCVVEGPWAGEGKKGTGSDTGRTEDSDRRVGRSAADHGRRKAETGGEHAGAEGTTGSGAAG